MLQNPPTPVGISNTSWQVNPFASLASRNTYWTITTNFFQRVSYGRSPSRTPAIHVFGCFVHMKKGHCKKLIGDDWQPTWFRIPKATCRQCRKVTRPPVCSPLGRALASTYLPVSLWNSWWWHLQVVGLCLWSLCNIPSSDSNPPLPSIGPMWVRYWWWH